MWKAVGGGLRPWSQLALRRPPSIPAQGCPNVLFQAAPSFKQPQPTSRSSRVCCYIGLAVHMEAHLVLYLAQLAGERCAAARRARQWYRRRALARRAVL